MGKIVAIDQLPKVLEKSKGNPIILVGGCFDILHLGHIKFLNNAKKLGGKLFVILESDEKIKKIKGINKPINNQKDRAVILSTLKSVDLVITIPFFNTDQEYFELVKTIKPDIIAVTKGDPLTDVKKSQAESVSGKLIEVMDRKNKYSTTKIAKNLLNMK